MFLYLVWFVTDYDAPIRYLFSSVWRDVRLLDKGDGVGAWDVADSLSKASEFVGERR